MKFSLTLLLAAVVACKPTVHLIRHGEKPADGGNGLSAQGVQRSQCLRTVFGNQSDYDIGYIMAQKYKKSEYCHEPPKKKMCTCADGHI